MFPTLISPLESNGFAWFLCVLVYLSSSRVSVVVGMVLGAGIGKNVENHVQGNVGCILVKTCYLFIYRYTISSSKCEWELYILYILV